MTQEERSFIINSLENGEKIPFNKSYTALLPMASKFIAQKRKQEKRYSLSPVDWDELLEEVQLGLWKAIENYDYKKNDSIEAWCYKIMLHFFNRKLNKIIKIRMKDEEASLVQIQEKNHFEFPSLQEKIKIVSQIKNKIAEKNRKNSEQTKISQELFLHFFGYYGDFGEELTTTESYPKSLDQLIEIFQIKSKTKIINSICSIQRILQDEQNPIVQTELLKKPKLTQRDYDLLEFIIEQNKKTDANGKPICPNRNDILGKGKFQITIRSRTVLSECIRRLKDSGYKFADQSSRNSNQGYLILNPELFNSISEDEKLAAKYLNELLPTIKDENIKHGIHLILSKINLN